jgi:hypothetical protein
MRVKRANGDADRPADRDARSDGGANSISNRDTGGPLGHAHGYRVSAADHHRRAGLGDRRAHDPGAGIAGPTTGYIRRHAERRLDSR